MSKIFPNNPAMPIQFEDGYGEQGTKVNRVFEGLTVRQQFAAMAMQGILTRYTLNKPEDQQIVCQISVELADELIKELNK